MGLYRYKGVPLEIAEKRKPHIPRRRKYNPREFGIQTNHQYPLCQGNTSLTLQDALCAKVVTHDSLDQVLSKPLRIKLDADFFFDDLEIIEVE